MKQEMVTISLDKYNALCSELFQANIDRENIVKERIKIQREHTKSQEVLFKVTKALIESKINEYVISIYDYNEYDLYDVCSTKYPILYMDYIELRDLGIEKKTIICTVIDKIAEIKEAEIKERERNE